MLQRRLRVWAHNWYKLLAVYAAIPTQVRFKIETSARVAQEKVKSSKEQTEKSDLAWQKQSRNEYIKCYLKHTPTIYKKTIKHRLKSTKNHPPEPPRHPWRPLGSQSCSKTSTFSDFELIVGSIWEPKWSPNRSYLYNFFDLLFGEAFVSPGPTLARKVIANGALQGGCTCNPLMPLHVS